MTVTHFFAEILLICKLPVLSESWFSCSCSFHCSHHIFICKSIWIALTPCLSTSPLPMVLGVFAVFLLLFLSQQSCHQISLPLCLITLP